MMMKIKFTKIKTGYKVGFRHCGSDKIAYIPVISLFRVIDKNYPYYIIFQLLFFGFCISMWYNTKTEQTFIIH